jgi:hypothetical protein
LTVDGGPFGSLILALVLVGATAVAALSRRRVKMAERSRAVLVGSILAAIVAIIGLSLLIVPVNGSTGAECGFWPTSDAFGPDGSDEIVREASNPVDRASTLSCIHRSRGLALASLVLVDGVAIYLVVDVARRRRRLVTTA